MKTSKVLWTSTHQTYYSAGDEAEPYCEECENYLQDEDNYCSKCGAELDWGEYRE